MTEEEKKAIEELEEFTKGPCEICKYCKGAYKLNRKNIIRYEALGYIQGYEDGKKLKRSAVANIVENQQYYIMRKEIEHYKEHIVKLQKENEELKGDLKYVLNQTLGAFEKNWCIDWNFTEIREKYNLESE